MLIIPRQTEVYSFGLVGLYVRHVFFFFILCAYRLRDYIAHSHETESTRMITALQIKSLKFYHLVRSQAPTLQKQLVGTESWTLAARLGDQFSFLCAIEAY